MLYFNKHTVKKRTLRILSILLLLAALSVSADAKIKTPKPTGDFFVNDFAGVLSADTKNHINQKSQQYHAGGGPQVVVATINSLEGDSIEDYSLQMARDWGIGSQKENNGILILLAVTERNIRVEVGYGLEATITDSLSGRFIREVTPELSAANYSEGIRELYDLILAELEEPGTYSSTQENGGPSIIFIILILVLMLFGGFFGPRRRRRYGGLYGGGSYHSGSAGGSFRGGGGGFGGGGASGRFFQPASPAALPVIFRHSIF